MLGFQLVGIKGAWQGTYRPLPAAIERVFGKLTKQGTRGAGVQQPSKSLTIAGSGEWKSTRWNIVEAAVHKKHHNWHKIFGNKKPTLKEIDPYVKEALTKGQWKKVDVLRKKGGKIIGDKVKLIQEVKGYKIWITGKLDSTGELIISNAAVQ